TGDTRLIGYIVPDTTDTDNGIDPTLVRRYARERLPEYMVPAAIMLLDQLPLTINGKLDKKALPTPEYTSGTPYRAPSTPAEQALAEIFQRVLSIERVGADDSFFDLGGNSLSAMRVIAGIR
ncbi:hypothetical protein JK358_38835, partial [Nocardia sp. 2]